MTTMMTMDAEEWVYKFTFEPDGSGELIKFLSVLAFYLKT